MTKSKRGFRQALANARKESGISLPKILGTALAAVTMALVSSRLTSVVNSLLIVAIVSIGSALASEFYRILLSVTAEKTHGVIAPIVIGYDQADSDQIETAMIDKVDQVVDDTLVGSATEISATPGHPDDGDEDTEVEVIAESGTSEHKSSWRSNQFVQLSLIFGVVALIAVGVSYGVAQAQGRSDIFVNYHTTVEQGDNTGLTPEERALLDELMQMQTDNGDILNTLTDLSTEISDLRLENERLITVIDELTTKLDEETARNDELQSRIDQLDEELHPEGDNPPSGEEQTPDPTSEMVTDGSLVPAL